MNLCIFYPYNKFGIKLNQIIIIMMIRLTYSMSSYILVALKHCIKFQSTIRLILI